MSNFEVSKLDNGVPVLLAMFPDGETTTLGITYNVGGRNEWKRGPSYDGISHFLEHQFFKGGENSGLDYLGVNEGLDNLGGIDNAFTTSDATCYFVKCLKSEIYNAIDLWEKILMFDPLNQEEFDKEAFVVRQEFRRMLDSPPSLLYRTLAKKLFEGTSLEMDVIGNEESLGSVTLEQMESYRDEHYGMENSALMVLGNFDKQAVFDNLNKTFGSKPVKDQRPRYEPTEYTQPSSTKLSTVHIDKETPLVFFGFGIKTPGAQSNDWPSLSILSAILDVGKSSLKETMLLRPGLTAFGFVIQVTYSDVGNFMFVAGSPPQLYEQAHNTMFQMFHKILTMEITEEYLSEIKERIEFERRRSSEDPFSILNSQSTNYWRFGKFMSMEDELEEIMKVTIQELNAVRTKVLSNLEGVYGTLGKLEKKEFSFPDGTWTGIFE